MLKHSGTKGVVPVAAFKLILFFQKLILYIQSFLLLINLWGLKSRSSIRSSILRMAVSD
jgi:hypothetical protein